MDGRRRFPNAPFLYDGSEKMRVRKTQTKTVGEALPRVLPGSSSLGSHRLAEIIGDVTGACIRTIKANTGVAEAAEIPGCSVLCTVYFQVPCGSAGSPLKGCNWLPAQGSVSRAWGRNLGRYEVVLPSTDSER